jgi:hypothetical protein
MNLGIRDYSQWFPGNENVIADALSRKSFLSDNELISFLRTTYPTQVPSHFEIVPVPNKISSWLTSLLLKLPASEPSNQEHTPTTPSPGHDGQTTAPPSDSGMTSSSTPLTPNNGHTSLGPSESPSEKVDIREKMQLPWLLRQSKMPSVTWLRPSSETADAIQPTTTKETSPGF